MPDNNLVGVTAGLAGLAIGWLVSGYQRVGEKITEERRAAYVALLDLADAVRADPAADDSSAVSKLRSAGAEAEFISSPQLVRSGYIAALARATTSRDDEQCRQAREAFLAGARADGLTNSAVTRWMRRRAYRRHP